MDSRIKEIVEDMMSSGFLLTRSWEKYILCVQFAKCVLKNEQLRPLLRRLSKESGAVGFGVWHLDMDVWSRSLCELILNADG